MRSTGLSSDHASDHGGSPLVPPAAPRARALETDRARQGLREARVGLESLGLRDPLTGVLSLQGLERARAKLARGASPPQRPQAVFVSINGFSQINRMLGRGAGDALLKEVAHCLERSLPPGGSGRGALGRTGGDEFLLLLPQADLEQALRVADRVRWDVSRIPFLLFSKPVALRVSVGVAGMGEGTKSLKATIATARCQIERGRHGEGRRLNAGAERSPLAPSGPSRQALRAALRRGGATRAVAQPIVRLSDGVPVGWELLSRCRLSRFEEPGAFFHACAAEGLLSTADHTCLLTCLEASRRLPLYDQVHFNLFPSTLLAIPIEQVIESLPPERGRGSYHVEISEQQIVGDPSYLCKAVGLLRNAGLKIAIDDVGFGLTCLESVIRLEPDLLKLDRRCVEGIDQNAATRRWAERLVGMAGVLGAGVVAEGVESRAEAHVLREVGISYGQGYFWGRPAPIPVGWLGSTGAATPPG